MKLIFPVPPEADGALLRNFLRGIVLPHGISSRAFNE